jgi:hypothetical protein
MMAGIDRTSAAMPFVLDSRGVVKTSMATTPDPKTIIALAPRRVSTS